MPLLQGFTPTEGHDAWIHRTNVGVQMSYSKGVRDPVGVAGTIRTDVATNLVNIQGWERISGRTRAFPLVIDTTVNEARFTRFADGYTVQPQYLSNTVVDVPVRFTDVARGLVF